VLTVGVVINPVAGIGGPAGLKGSDGTLTQARALAAGVAPAAVARMRAALAPLAPVRSALRFKTWAAEMGAAAFDRDWQISVLGAATTPTSASDTRTAVATLVADGIDILLFAGGDGTARDVLDALGDRVPVLGVPAGVKMQSGVFAVTPADAGAILLRLIRGEWVAEMSAEVRDIDEAALREGRVSSRHYGYLRVPQVGGYVQHVKSGGREDELLVHVEIARFLAEQLVSESAIVVLGPGTTVAALKSELGIDGTLLGFDVLHAGRLLARDADARQLEALVDADTIVVVSFTGGQGFLFGRGNQQLSPTVLRRIARGNLRIVATRTKIAALDGAPLLVDTGDVSLDESYFGVVPVIVGYDDVLLYRIARAPEQ
jgi:predicted polyphosphate/ATP-dependent NAD kinase